MTISVVIEVVVAVMVLVRATVVPTAIVLVEVVVITDVQCTSVSQALGHIFHMCCLSPKMTCRYYYSSSFYK